MMCVYMANHSDRFIPYVGSLRGNRKVDISQIRQCPPCNKQPEGVDRSQQNGNSTRRTALRYEIDTCVRMSVNQFQIPLDVPSIHSDKGSRGAIVSYITDNYATLCNTLSSSVRTACESLMRARRALRTVSSPFGSIPSATN